MNDGTEPQTDDGAMVAVARAGPFPPDATVTPTATPRVIRRTWRAAGGDYPITAGDRVTVGATPGDTLSVWWYGAEHHRDGTRFESATFAKG